jgi:hypothetical protein
MQDRSIVAVPFRIAAGFLLLMFLWGFSSEEASMSNPNKYEYEHFKKSSTGDKSEVKFLLRGRVNIIISFFFWASTHQGEVSHGSYMPWKPSVSGRTMHLDTDAIVVGNRVQLHGLTSRVDLNGITGRLLCG